MRPNGLPISRRERITKSLSKTNDLAREAVGCIPPSRRAVTPHQMTGRHSLRILCAEAACHHHGRVRRAGLSFRVAARMTAPRLHKITPAQRALFGITTCTRSRNARRTFSTTSVRTTPAPRANARRKGYNGRSLLRRAIHENGIADHAAQRPNGMPISRAATDRSGKFLCQHQRSKKRGSCGRVAASTAWAGWAVTLVYAFDMPQESLLFVSKSGSVGGMYGSMARTGLSGMKMPSR
jgi:hypothetical protein